MWSTTAEAESTTETWLSQLSPEAAGLHALMRRELELSNSVPEVEEPRGWAYADRETLDSLGW